LNLKPTVLKKVIVIILCLTFIGDINAQSRRKKRNSEKSYSFLKIENGVNYSSNIGWQLTDYKIGQLEISPSKLTEISLVYSFYNKDRAGDIFKGKTLGIEYYRSLGLLKLDSDKFSFGIYGSLLYRLDKYIPRASNTYPVDERCYCVSLGPKLYYIKNISEKFKATLTASVNIVNLGSGELHVRNPNIDTRAQKRTFFYNEFLQEYFRVGIGIAFRT